MANTALIHFYRGELGRLAIYRVRLDTTTNWAIGVSVAVLTFALGQPEAPHTLLVLPYLLTTVFLFIESRRYQELDMLQRRIRVLETRFFAPMLRGEPELDAEAAQELAASLEDPTPRLHVIRAMAHRTRRNYLWLLLANHGGWWIKLYLVAESVGDVGLGRLKGEAVIAIAVLSLLPWLVLALVSPKVD